METQQGSTRIQKEPPDPELLNEEEVQSADRDHRDDGDPRDDNRKNWHSFQTS